MSKPRGNPNMRKGAKSINPTGKSKVNVEVADSWHSALSGSGVVGRDRVESYDFTTTSVSSEDAADLWRGDALAARAVELPANDMTRGGYALALADKSAQEYVLKAWQDTDIFEHFRTAIEYERAYGGAAIYIGTESVGKLTQPARNVRSITHFAVFQPCELVPKTWYANPLAPNFGRPETYELRPVLSDSTSVTHEYQVIHESRFLLFYGNRVSRKGVNNNGFGDSIFTRMRASLRDYNIGWQSTATLLQDFAPAVHKLANLASLLNTNGGQNKLQARLDGINMARATAREVIIDKDHEEWNREVTPVSGLAELLRESAVHLAACTEIPVNLLMGMTSSGLNASDEYTLRIWYAKVAAMQETKVIPHLSRLVGMWLDIRGASGQEFTLEANPLFQRTEQEIADARYTNAQADAIYLANGVLGPEEVLQRFIGDTYSHDIMIDLEEHKALELSEADEQEAINEAVPEPNESAEP